MNYVDGTDVSKWQYPCQYKLGYEHGLRFAIIRATIGNYYTDPNLRDMWNGYKDAGFLVSAYLVTAPRNYDGGTRISGSAHLERFTNAVAGLVPDLPWVVDAELSRQESNGYITQLHKDVVNGLKQAYGKEPIIYTRQSWWDYHVNADPLWPTCDLFAARYSSFSLTSPWSDGNYKFRDWKTWKFWQYTASADGGYYGFASQEGDLDYFNGDLGSLYSYAGLTPPMSLEDKVDILWREAYAHGWNLEPS